MKKLSCLVVIVINLVAAVSAQPLEDSLEEAVAYFLEVVQIPTATTDPEKRPSRSMAGLSLRLALLRYPSCLGTKPLVVNAKGISILIQILEENLGEYSVIEAAIETLGRIGPPARDAVPALIGLLDNYDKNRSVFDNCAVIKALGKIGSLAAVPALLRVVRSGNEYQLECVAIAVGEIADAAPGGVPHEIVEVIGEFFTHWNPQVRLAALKMLEKAEMPVLVSAIPKLLHRVYWGCIDEREPTRMLLEKAASCPEAVPVLIPLVLLEKGPEQELQADAQAHLVKLGAQAVPELLEVLQGLSPGDIEAYRKKALILDLLGEIGPYAYPAREVLLAWISETLSEKAQVLYILGEIGNPGDMDLFLEASVDVEWGIRWRAVEALGKYLPFLDEGNERTRVLAALVDAVEDSDPAVADAAKEALASSR